MEIHTLKCPNCGADIVPADDVDSFYCNHCGAKLIVEGRDHAIDAKVRLSELKHEEEMARIANEHDLDKIKEQKTSSILSILTRKEIIDGAIVVIGIIIMLLIVKF